jgi:hypothetical protein
MKLSLKSAALLALASAVPALAEVKLNENFSVSGYAVGSYTGTNYKPGEYADRFDLDAVKTAFTANFKPVSGTISFYHVPGAPDSITVLDAYATYDVGNGVTVTGGKFLSYLGYEAFDIPNMLQLSYANGDFLAPIPGYHSGLRLDYGDETQAAGVALVDSVYSGPNYLKGDGELKHNAGFEAFYSYKGIKDLTLWTGIGYDTKGNVIHKDDEIFTWDFWAQYTIDSKSFVAGEIAMKDGGAGDKGYNWLALYSYAVTDKVSTVFRVSGEDVKDGASLMRYTFAPTYTLTSNLSVRAEYSYTDYKDNPAADQKHFFGVQAIFKF